jgi:hypothetical protein
MVLAAVVLAVPRLGADQPTSTLTLDSSSEELNESFLWAKGKALSLVRTDTGPDHIPCYFAAMSDTEFCVRDVAHMMEGAHLLGLDRENWSMMHLFAFGANRRVNGDHHWPRWHYPYRGGADDKGGSCQWRCLPTPFDMAWRCYEQYLWTGDDRWINDKEMFDYHTNLHTTFMEHQRWDDNPVADELRQLASYYEFPKAGEHFVEAGDAIGCQYQALSAYAAILEHRGDSAAAIEYRKKAEHLRAYFETHWFDPVAKRYIRGFDRFTDFKSDWGRENSYFIPMTLITDQGPRTADYLDFIDDSITRQPLNIEAYTYIPEVFYKHGRNETGWKYLKHLMKTRASYPEVSFACVGNTIAGMMGVWPDAPNNKVSTLPRLPRELGWVEADHVTVGKNDLRVRHEGNRRTTLQNNKGPALNWEARFAGNYQQLQVGGVAKRATVTTLNGRTISYATVRVAQGETVEVTAQGDTGPDLPVPISPRLRAEPPPPAPEPGTYVLSDMPWRYAAARRDDAIKVNKGHRAESIKISDVEYKKGISAAANTAIRYDLHRQYSRLLCDAGFDASVADGMQMGSVELVVYGGTNVSKLLYTSGVLRADEAAMRHVNIDVSDCDYIILGVKDARDGDRGDHICWANARLIARGGNADTEAPTAPKALRLTDMKHNSATLEWTTSTDNLALRGYDIYRGTRNVGSSTSPTFKVTGLCANTSYRFTVKAWDADGNTSAASPSAEATTPLTPGLAYLSELDWEPPKIGFGSIGKDRSVNGKPITLNSVRYERGLGTHAMSEIVFDLEKLGRPYERFISDVGVDDEVSAMSSVVFQVFVDGKRVYDSGTMTPDSETKTVDVGVAGIKQLRLVVTDAGDGINSDHADWANARLVDATREDDE